MKLYKKDTKGKIRVLEIYNEGDEVVQISGLLDGKKTETRSKCIPKNIGRANETSAEEQAIKEAKAKFDDKLTKGYFLTEDEAKNEVVIRPMLAKDAKKELHKIEYPCFIQPKLDGMRANANVMGMASRQGKAIETCDHILRNLESINEILDGELYAHGLSFQENISLIKKYREGETEKIHYHVYDLMMDAPFKERYDLLAELVEGIDNVRLVETLMIFNKDELKHWHSVFLEQGYEGSIIRWGDAPYKMNARSSNLLKYKDFIDEAYKVIDIIPMEKRPEQGKALCRMDEKKWLKLSSTGKITDISDEEVEGYVYDYPTFTANFKMPFTKREEILTNKKEYIGQTAEIRFFEYTDSGLPRFPVCFGFRLDK